MENANSNYGFKKSVAEKVECLNYIVRSTFLDRNWDNELADELYGFKNMRTWGKWSGEMKWELTEVDRGEEIKAIACRKLERSICPDCGMPIKWGGVQDILMLQVWQAAGWVKPLGGGYFRLWDEISGIIEEIEKEEVINN